VDFCLGMTGRNSTDTSLGILKWPPAAEQLAVIDDITGKIENVARAAMDRQTANNRVEPRSNKSK
jgi:hypothetical protein